MWQAAQPVPRKFPRTAVGRVQRWQELHSFLKSSKTRSPDSWTVGSGSKRTRAPAGMGWPFGSGSPGAVGTGASEKRTCSFVGWSPFGKSVPDCVPERWAMMFALTFRTIVLWQSVAPHVWATTRRSEGFAYMPAWAFRVALRGRAAPRLGAGASGGPGGGGGGGRARGRGPAGARAARDAPPDEASEHDLAHRQRPAPSTIS